MQAISLLLTMGNQHYCFCCNSWHLLDVRFAKGNDFYFFLLLSCCFTNAIIYCIRYIGDENGLMSVLRYDSEEGKLLRLPYNIPAKAIIGSFFLLAVRILQYYHVDLFCFRVNFLKFLLYDISILIIYPLGSLIYFWK